MRNRRLGVRLPAVIVCTLALADFPAMSQVQSLTFFQPPVAAGEFSHSNGPCYLNEAGVVAANAQVFLAGAATRRISFTLKGAEFQMMGVLAGHDIPIVSAINARGDVAGTLLDLTTQRRVLVMWTNGIPRLLPVPPPPGGSNYWIPSPVALDERGRVLVYLTEMSPANQPVDNAKAFLLDNNRLTGMPVFTPGGPVTAVFNQVYLDIRPSGQILGSALVTRLGQLRTIGLLYHAGSFTEILVDDLFQIAGMNPKGEVLCRRFDGSLVVWRNGQVQTLPTALPPEQIFQAGSWNAKGQTCASVRVVRNTPGNWSLNAVLNFGQDGSR